MPNVIKHRRSAEAEAWLRKEIADQKRRYRKIVREQDALAPKREKWVAAFFERIQTRGYNVHYADRRVIKPEELPSRPKRKFRVVF